MLTPGIFYVVINLRKKTKKNILKKLIYRRILRGTWIMDYSTWYDKLWMILRGVDWGQIQPGTGLRMYVMFNWIFPKITKKLF